MQHLHVSQRSLKNHLLLYLHLHSPSSVASCQCSLNQPLRTLGRNSQMRMNKGLTILGVTEVLRPLISPPAHSSQNSYVMTKRKRTNCINISNKEDIDFNHQGAVGFSAYSIFLKHILTLCQPFV